MHPELLRALAREHRAELLRHHQYRQRSKTPPDAVVRATRPLRRVRLAMGTVLVTAGTRLLASAPSRVDVVSSRR
jgi:hypothetical protein